MRLGIRRKLIGTLMLVGLIPLALSLIVILGGGAGMQLSRIRTTYESAAASSAHRIADNLLRDELKSLTLAARDPEVHRLMVRARHLLASKSELHDPDLVRRIEAEMAAA